MGKYKFGIVSYNRADKQFMLEYLVSLGYKRDDIILQTQNKDDFGMYERLFCDKAIVTYKEGSNVSENKNNLLEWYKENCDPGSRLIICSDKVRGVVFLGNDGRLHIMGRDELEAFLQRAFFIARQTGASLFGTYTVKNAFYMSHSVHINQFLLGCFMGIVEPRDITFDPQQPLKEDWEIMLRTISKGGRVVRFNDIALDATFRTSGGCHDAWKSGDKNAECTARLLSLYPSLVKRHATREDELKYIGPTQRINKSILRM